MAGWSVRSNPAKKARILAAVRRGEKYLGIAAMEGTTSTTVSYHARKAGVFKRQWKKARKAEILELLRAGKTNYTLALQFGLSRGYIRFIARVNGVNACQQKVNLPPTSGITTGGATANPAPATPGTSG